MSVSQQQLLRRHRRQKRMTILLICLPLLGSIIWLTPWWSWPLFLGLAWIVHELWFADHLFYSPRSDYQYRFPAEATVTELLLQNEHLPTVSELIDTDTLILELRLRASWLGHWLDPYVKVADDRQTFERGLNGRRYLNLSGLTQALRAGELSLKGRFCHLPNSAKLYSFSQPDYAKQRLMILAPHADDAELAAFGLYQRSPEVSIVTLTQGELKAKTYQKMGLDKAQAARLKGRLRSWDSLTVPLWGNVPTKHCVQLGYYCLQLPRMAGQPNQICGSSLSGDTDVRTVRQHNALRLPADLDGRPTWHNLLADLVALLEHFRPEVVVTPHPELDPHPDHVATTQALWAAIAQSSWKPQVALLYANHLHDNDRWPMGTAGCGIALPPTMTALPPDSLWSPILSSEVQIDKAMALAMHHDLQHRLTLKRRLRRLLQRWMLGRRWSKVGHSDFFRKAVRRHELFWVRMLSQIDH